MSKAKEPEGVQPEDRIEDGKGQAAPPAEPSKPPAAPKEKKTRGRPPGSKSTPKGPKVPPGTPGESAQPTRTRKTADQIKDTGKAIKRSHADQIALIKKHNKEHPNAKLAIPEDPFKVKPGTIVPIPQELFEMTLRAIIGGECMMLGMPHEIVTEQQIVSCAASWHQLSKLVQLDFMIWLAAINVGATTLPLVIQPALLRFTMTAEERAVLRQAAESGVLQVAIDNEVAKSTPGVRPAPAPEEKEGGK